MPDDAGDHPEPGATTAPASAGRDRRLTPPPGWPGGQPFELPGRGRTWVYASEPLEAFAVPGPPVLVLLHGWTATAGLNWFTSFPMLADHYRVLAVDHRGHGKGIRSEQRFRLADCADDVAVLADELGIGSFVPVGYSMGGPIAQLVWHRHRSQVDGLVLCATSRNFQGSSRERAMIAAMTGLAMAAVRVTPLQWQQSMGQRFYSRRFDDTGLGRWARNEIAGNDARALVEAGAAIGAFSSRDWIGEVDVPTAVVLTEQDQVVPPLRQRALADAIPGATVHPVRGDHAVCASAPSRFVPALLAACRSVTTRVASDGRAAG